MNTEEQPMLRRWAGMVAVATLLTVCLVLLGGQVATSAPELPPEGVTVLPQQSLADAYILLEKNDGYYGAAGVVITQVTSYFFDQDEAWSRYQAGELDTITPPDSALETILVSPIYSPQLHALPRPGTYFYGFSTDVEPLDDPLLRAALASAIDRTRLISEVLTGDELPALTFTPPRHVGYVDGYATGIGRPYSPTLALDLLTQSGYSGDPPITLMVNTSDYHQSIAEAVRDMWYETLGISATVEHLPWADYNELLQNGSAEERPGVWRSGWISDYPDAHNWHGVFFGTLVGPLARYDSPAYDALVKAAAGETNLSTRLDLYEQAEATLVESDTVVVPMWSYMLHRLTRPDLLRTYRSYGGQRLDEWSFSGDPRPIEVAWGAPNSLDPALSLQWDYVDQLFLGLTDIDPETGAVVPELATTWDVTPDATVYTFTLHSDAVWTDGKPVTAYDVEYGVLRSLDPATGGGYAWVLWDIQNAQEYNQGDVTDPDLVGVEALDSTHIRFTLARPAAYFPVIAGLPPARPQPQWAIDAHGGAWTDPANIVSNGPYTLIHWDQAPYLRIEKWSEHAPISGGDWLFTIRYRNDGGADAAHCVITDTMLGGLSYVSDTSGFSHTGSGSGPIVWDLGTIPAYSSAEFEVTVKVTAPFRETVTNRAQIATDDPNDQGSAGEKESEWQEDVAGPRVGVNYGEDRASGVYPVGHTFWITVTESNGTTVKATASVETTPEGSMQDGGWYDGFVAEGDDWSPSRPDIQPNDWVHYRSDDGYTNSVQVGTIMGVLDTEEDTVAGTVTVPWFASQTLEGIAGAWGFWWESFNLDLDATGEADYLVDFSPMEIPSGWALDVHYHEPDGDYVVNSIQSLDLVMDVNYGHDWVEGNYEPGHTLWITVTESDGTTVKATAELQTQEIPWWGGRTGFSTNLGEPWQPDRPDIETGDYVYGRMSTGYTSTVRIGTITGNLDLANDTVAGTITADWFTETLGGWCSVWEDNGPWQELQVDPGGGSYFCDFSSEWDLQPGHQVGVGYVEPAGNEVINVFQTPAPDLYLEKWSEGSGEAAPGGPAVFTIRYRNEGDAVAQSIRLTDTLPSGATYLADSSGITPDTGPGWVAWDLGPLQPDHEARFQLVLAHNTGPGETLRNEAEIYTPYDTEDWDNYADAEVYVTDGQPDLHVNKQPEPQYPYQGQTMLWEINYGNNNSVASGPVVLTDTLPPGTTLVSWQSNNGYHLWTPHNVPGKLVLKAPSIPGYWGDQILLRLRVTAPQDTQLHNRVEIATDNDSDPGNNSDERDDVWVDDDQHYNGYLDKSFGWGRLVPGGYIGYNVHVRNFGNMATDFVLTEDLPAGTHFVESWRWTSSVSFPFPPNYVDDKVAVWNVGTLEPGEWRNWNIRLGIDGDLAPGTVLTNCADVQISGDERWPEDNHDCAIDTVRMSGPNLRVYKQYDWEWEGQIRYYIYFENIGTQTLYNVDIVDTLPGQTSLDSWGHDFWRGVDFQQSGDQLIWTLSEIQPGDSSRIEYRANLAPAIVGEPGWNFVNDVQASVLDDVYPADNEDQVTASTGPDIYVDKWVSGGSLAPGGILTFTIQFGNQNRWPWGSSDLDPDPSSYIQDTLPDGMTFVHATAPWDPGESWQPQFLSNNRLRWDWGSMGHGQSWQFYLAAQIDGTVEPGDVLVNRVEAYSYDLVNDVDPNIDNNTKLLAVTVTQSKLYLPLVVRNY